MFAIAAKPLMQSEIGVIVLLFITTMFITWDFNELVSSWPCSLSSLPCGCWICMMSKKASRAKWGSGSGDHEKVDIRQALSNHWHPFHSLLHTIIIVLSSPHLQAAAATEYYVHLQPTVDTMVHNDHSPSFIISVMICNI